MAVIIDIPGVGTVEAKNAASESTLQEILKALKGKTGGTTGGAGAGAAGAGQSATTATKAQIAASTALGKSFGLLGKSVGLAAGGVGKLASGVAFAAGKAVNFGEKVFGVSEALANLNGSASSVANLFSGIPLAGTAFKVVAGAADDVVKSYNAVSSVGATFGGSIQNFSKSASEAGMAMDQFASLIKSNGEAMGAFGVTTEDGAKRFGQVSKALRTTSSDLYALGFSTQEINQGLASYGKTLRLQGHQGKQTNAELAAGAKNYLKEMDMLAKVTGQERAAKEKEREALLVDGMFRAAMAGLGPEVENSVATMIQAMPNKELQDFAKDLIANGTATTEANRKLMAQQPQLAAQLTALHKQTQSNVAVSKDQMNQALNTGKAEGMAAMQRSKTALAASEEWQGTAAAMGGWNKVNLDGIKVAQEQQEESKKNTDGFNEKMQAMQQRISEVSNNFKGMLASSGILDVLMSAFEFVANVATQYLIPAFNIISSIVVKVADGIGMLLMPVIEYVSEKFGASGLGGTVEWIDGLLNTVFDVLGGTVRGLVLVFDGLWDGVSALIDPITQLWTNIFGVSDSTETFGDLLIDVGEFVGDAFRVLGKVLGVVINIFDAIFSPILKGIVAVFKGMWFVIKGVTDIISNFGDYWQNLMDVFDEMSDGLLRFLNKVTLGASGITEEEQKRRADTRALQKEEREAARASRVKDAEDHKAGLKEDRKQLAEKKATHEKLTTAAKKEADVKEAAVKANEKLMDYNSGPEALLKAFSAKEGGLVEKGVKKDELGKQISAAQSEFESAKTDAAKKAAAEKVLTLQKQMGAIDNPKGASSDFNETAKALAGANSSPKSAAQNAETAKKEIEAEAEKKKAEAAKKAQDYKNEEEAAKREFEKENKKPATQESAETLLAQLNTNMAELIKVTKEQKDIGERQLTVQKSLTGDLFAAV